MQTQIYNIRQLSAVQIAQIAHALSTGAIAVFATDTVYGLGTGAFCEPSIGRIYALKNRPATQPLQLLVATLAQAQEIITLNAGALRVAQTFWPGGLTLIALPTRQGRSLLRGSQALGIRIPAYQPLQTILAQMTMPLASTSANVHGAAVLTDVQSVQHTFAGQVDYILTDGALSPVASSVLDVTQDTPRLLRAGTISPEELTRVYHAAEETSI